VPDAARAGDRLLLEQRREASELALAPHDARAVALLHGDAGRVVAAVFEPPKALEQERRRFSRARVADDSAHENAFIARTRDVSIR
jgi:hypothetical protein